MVFVAFVALDEFVIFSEILSTSFFLVIAFGCLSRDYRSFHTNDLPGRLAEYILFAPTT